MKNIIYLISSPFFLRDYYRFGCAFLDSKGYGLEIWYIPIDGDPSFVSQAGMYHSNNLFVLSVKEYNMRVLSNCDAIFVSLHFSSEVLLPLINNNCKYILYGGFGRIPLYHSLIKEKTGGDTLSFRFLTSGEGVYTIIKRRFRKTIREKKEKEYRRIVYKNPPALIVTSVKPCINECFRVEEVECSKKIVYVHSFDYDRYIETNRVDDSCDENYIVYIDSGIYLLSYDAVRENIYNDVREYISEYFQQTNVLFERLSMYYDLPVIIAGHPHVYYPDNAYNGRRIVFNRTCELVKHAKVVITTDSTAISFAVLYNKPLVHVFNKRLHTEIEKQCGVCWDEWIMYKAGVIEKVGWIDMDKDDDMICPWNQVMRFDTEKRDLYIKEYIIDNATTEETTYEVLEKEISKM